MAGKGGGKTTPKAPANSHGGKGPAGGGYSSSSGGASGKAPMKGPSGGINKVKGC
jgi:hypothetical protein